MAKKRKVYLHVGVPGGPGEFVEAALLAHEHALAELGVRSPIENADEMFRAAIEITRAHKAWGYKRREVEGAWAGVCRRILKAKGRDHTVISQPLLAAAGPEQIDLLVDTLPGLAVHVVVIAGTDQAAEAAELLRHWERAVRKPERLHLLEVEPDAPRSEVWRSVGSLIGFGTASLSVDGLTPAPCASLGEALVQVDRLRRRNETLELQLAGSERRWRRRRHDTAA